MGPVGFEPTTLRLKVECSSQLSYGPYRQLNKQTHSVVATYFAIHMNHNINGTAPQMMVNTNRTAMSFVEPFSESFLRKRIFVCRHHMFDSVKMKVWRLGQL